LDTFINATAKATGKGRTTVSLERPKIANPKLGSAIESFINATAARCDGVSWRTSGHQQLSEFGRNCPAPEGV